MAASLTADIAARLPEGFQEFLDRLIAEFDPDRVILFGSRARGEATEDSDTDLLVVMPCEGLPIRTAIKIRLALRSDFPMDLVVLTPEEFQRRLVGPRLDFVQIVDEEGAALYERVN